jgi:hypothetical protein
MTEKTLLPFRSLFAHQALFNQGDGIFVIQGKWGRIYPYSLDGQTLGLNYVSEASFPSLSTHRINRLREALRPYIDSFTALEGEYEATFPREHLLAVAQIIRVKKRGKAPQHNVRFAPRKRAEIDLKIDFTSRGIHLPYPAVEVA